MTFAQMIKSFPEEIQRIARKLRRLVRSLDDEIMEDYYGGEKVKMALYTYGNKNNPIAGISLAKDHCKLFLHHFNRVNTQDLKIQGSGKHARHVKFRKVEEVELEKLEIILGEILGIARKRVK